MESNLNLFLSVVVVNVISYFHHRVHGCLNVDAKMSKPSEVCPESTCFWTNMNTCYCVTEVQDLGHFTNQFIDENGEVQLKAPEKHWQLKKITFKTQPWTCS